MKIKRLLFAAVGVAMAFVGAEASPAFIQHRQDAFKAVPTSSEQIVFLGNSITNFHCWADAFVRPDGKGQDVALISNRGISDERAYHWKHTVQMMLDGEQKPAKMFIGIGTNDLNVGLPPEVVVNDIRAIIRQVQISSPETEITLQSILPRRGDINNVVMRTLPLLEEMAEEMGVNFVDLSEVMSQVPNNSEWAYDGLHPSAVGYRAWCRHISPLVGLDCAYTDAAYSTGGFGAVAGVRAGQYGMMPVEEDDILILGDPWVDAVQWHEFFGNHNVKNRSICNGNLSVDNVKVLLDRTLKANDRQKCPRAIVLCWGAIRSGNNLNASTAKSDYESLIDYAQAAAPQAKIIVCQTPAINNDNHTFNVEVGKITSVPVVDLEANGMTVATASTWNMAGGLGSKGVLKAAQAVGKVLNAELGDGTAKIVTDEEFSAYYANRNRRIEVAKCYNALYEHRLAASSDISAALSAIEAILKGNIVTDAQVTEARKVRDDALTARQFSPDPEKWYHISAPRNYEGGDASVGTLGHSNSNPYFFDNKLSATTTNGSDIWSFIQRPDGSYDICSFDGYYLVPGNNPTVSKAYPAEGWTIEGGYAETGTYVIRSGNIHLHRGSNNNVLNYWHPDDTGSHFYLTEFSGDLPVVGEGIADGWVTINIESGFNVNSTIAGKSVFNHPAGIKRFNGFYEVTIGDVDEKHPASELFRVVVNNDGTWSLYGLTGHVIKTDGVADRTNSTQTIAVNQTDNSKYNLGYWIPFSENGIYMIGKSGSNVAEYTVKQASVDDYDVWTVNIVAKENTLSNIANLIDDTHVSLDIPANKGLKTVYNGGVFMLEPGTEFTAADLAVECPNIANQGKDHADVVIDSKSKTIFVDYSEGLPNGWYTFDLHSMEGTNVNAQSWLQGAQSAGMTSLINTDGVYEQSASNFYMMGFADPQENLEARRFFYLTSTDDNVYTMRTLHGYYVKDAATASYDPVDLPTPPHATDEGVYKTTFMVWDHNLAADIKYLAGKFSGNSMYYTVKPASVEDFDIYEVRMIEGYRGSKMTGDATVTLNSEHNRGIPTVCDGGTFFVTKGAELTPEMLTATSVGIVPRISVADGLITVDYSAAPVESIVLDHTELTLKPGETATLTATVLPDYAFNKTVYWVSSDEEVATVDDAGVVTALKTGNATISAMQGVISASCEVTVAEDISSAMDAPFEQSMSVQEAAARGEVVDLMGRRVSRPDRGIFIVNGKKMKL